MASEITKMLDRVRANPDTMSALARSEAERLFAPEVVCVQISSALQRLVGAAADGRPARAAADGRPAR
jgi:hypothetical protein